MIRHHRTRALLLLLGLSLVRGMIYSAVIPPWQAPDEFRHFEYIKLLRQERHLLTAQDMSLPLQREIIASMVEHHYWEFGRAAFPFDPENPPQSFQEIIWPSDPYWLFQPPLYYLMGVFPVALAEDVDLQLYAVRLMSVVLGTLVVLVAFLTAVDLFPDDDFLIIGIPAFITFLPMHTFITSVANNDNLAEWLVSVVVLILVKVYKDGLSLLRVALIGLLVVLGLLAKRTAILTIPLLVVAIPIYFWRGRGRACRLNRKGVGLIVGLILTGVVARGLLWDAGRRLWGDMFPTLRPYLILIPGADFSALFTSEGLHLLACYAEGLFESAWARFGWMNVRLDSIWYQMMALVSVAALGGVGRFASRALRRRTTLARWQGKCLLLFALCVLFAMAIAMGYSVRLWAHFQTFRPEMAPSPQGRYLFPAMIPMATLFMLGLRELVSVRYRKGWLLTCISGLMVFDAISLVRYILPFFYG
jgi:hypothetical protein